MALDDAALKTAIEEALEVIESLENITDGTLAQALADAIHAYVSAISVTSAAEGSAATVE